MTPLDILIASRNLIINPSRWSTPFLACDSSQASTLPESPTAVSWCAIGAIHKIASYDTTAYDALDMLHDSCISLYNLPTEEVNDILGHPFIIKAYDDAINRLQSKNKSKALDHIQSLIREA